jgi:hypothetical protein
MGCLPRVLDEPPLFGAGKLSAWDVMRSSDIVCKTARKIRTFCSHNIRSAHAMSAVEIRPDITRA